MKGQDRGVQGLAHVKSIVLWMMLTLVLIVFVLTLPSLVVLLMNCLSLFIMVICKSREQKHLVI